jgi:hypothetical protein
MYMTPEERERYENEEIRFKQDHPNCKAGAWTIQGSLTKHCFKCCPPAPFRKLVRPSNDVPWPAWLRHSESCLERKFDRPSEVC